MKLKGLPAVDKVKHFGVGFAISTLTGALLLSYLGEPTAPLAGLAVGVLAGIAKELYDKFSERGVPDIMDAVFTAFGSVGGMVLVGAFL